MPKFTKDWSYNSTTHSGDFQKGQEAPIGYSFIIDAAIAEGALPAEAKDNGFDNASKKDGAVELKG